MLGMYDMPAIQPANDRFWSRIRAHLGFGPQNLTRDADPWDIWQAPDLVLAQTCGLPFRSRLHEIVNLVGTPDYALPGCPPGYYNSVLIVRANAVGHTEQDFSGGVFACNELLSQSGWAGPMTHLNALGVEFSDVIKTGSHAASALAVAEGRADLAGVDAVTWNLLCEHDTVVGALRELNRTRPTPGLPYVTARGNDPETIAKAVRAAILDLNKRDRVALHLAGFVGIPKKDYLSVPTPPTA